jgi:hypothetical protein
MQTRRKCEAGEESSREIGPVFVLEQPTTRSMTRYEPWSNPKRRTSGCTVPDH